MTGPMPCVFSGARSRAAPHFPKQRTRPLDRNYYVHLKVSSPFPDPRASRPGYRSAKHCSARPSSGSGEGAAIGISEPSSEVIRGRVLAFIVPVALIPMAREQLERSVPGERSVPIPPTRALPLPLVPKGRANAEPDRDVFHLPVLLHTLARRPRPQRGCHGIRQLWLCIAVGRDPNRLLSGASERRPNVGKQGREVCRADSRTCIMNGCSCPCRPQPSCPAPKPLR